MKNVALLVIIISSLFVSSFKGIRVAKHINKLQENDYKKHRDVFTGESVIDDINYGLNERCYSAILHKPLMPSSVQSSEMSSF